MLAFIYLLAGKNSCSTELSMKKVYDFKARLIKNSYV